MTEYGSADDIMLVLRRGWEMQQRGQLDEAEHAFRTVLAQAPAQPDALHFLGLIEAQRGRTNEAVALLNQSLSYNPKNPHALFNCANLLRILGRVDEAIINYDRILALKPNHVGALADRGSALHAAGRFAEALDSYDRALAFQPDQPATLYNRAMLLCALGRKAEAVLGFDRALKLKPDHINAIRNRGKVLCELKREHEALAGYDQAIAANPANADLHADRAEILAGLGEHDRALEDYGRALAIAPLHAEAAIGRSQILTRQSRNEEALTDLDRALSIVPDDFRGLGSRGSVLSNLRRFKDACVDFERALALRPEHPYLRGSILECKLNCCDWRTIEELGTALRAAVSAGQRVARPIVSIIATDSPELQLQCAKISIQSEFAAAPTPLWRGERYEHRRVRIGYLAPELGFNPVATQLAGVLKTHDRSRFEVALVPFGRDHRSAMRSRLESACERVVDIHAMSDEDASRHLRSMEFDILVDLAGLTGSNRVAVLAFRPAPIQVVYLGFPGTMGSDFIDYIIADRVVIPESDRRHYSEHVACLPDTFMPNDSIRPISGQKPTRIELGLPADGFVFCCFNNSFKYTPEMFDIWMRLLKRVENSVLWLPRFNEAVVENLGKEAEERQVSAKRLVFARFVASPAEHLARLQAADLFLDTLPYNAHATACDALWVGLPVVTCMGRSFAARVGASLLYAVGLPELITETKDEYEALAFKLASDRSRLAEVRAKLIRNRDNYPLFDTGRYTRHLEAAFHSMWQRYQAGDPPAAFEVTRVPAE